MITSLEFQQQDDQKPPQFFYLSKSDYVIQATKIMQTHATIIYSKQKKTQKCHILLYEQYIQIDINGQTFIFPFQLTITFEAIKDKMEIKFQDEQRQLQVAFKFQNQQDWQRFYGEIKRQLFQTKFQQKYGIIDKIGSGRTSQVYKIIEKQTGTIYAAKHYSNIPSSIQKELKLLKLLEHPNLIYFHEMFISPGEVFIIMDYEDGGNLLQKIKAEQFLSMKEKTKFLIDMLNALEFMRIKGIVHRDLKPQNILYSKKDDSYKISDFGLAIFINDSTAKTVGTPGYIAPQSFDLDEQSQYTHYSDIYSLGLIYFELATKKTFYPGESVEMVLQGNRKGKSLKKMKYSKDHISDLEYDVLRMMVRSQPQKRMLSIQILQSSELRKLVKQYSLGKKSVSSSTSSNKKSPTRKSLQFQVIQPNVEEENFMDVMKKILKIKSSV